MLKNRKTHLNTGRQWHRKAQADRHDQQPSAQVPRCRKRQHPGADHRFGCMNLRKPAQVG